MYRNDWDAAVARATALENELRNAQQKDAQQIASLQAQLHAARAELARLQAQVGLAPPGVRGVPYPQFRYGPRGNTVLVLGILSIMLCAILGPIAWSMGNEEMKRIDRGETDPEQRSAAQAGYICGIIASCLLLLGVLALVSLFVFVASIGGR